MDIQTRKIEFVQEFLKLQNEEIILLFEKLLKSSVNSLHNNTHKMSLQELNRRIDQSLSNSDNESVIDADDLISEIEGWR